MGLVVIKTKKLLIFHRFR